MNTPALAAEIVSKIRNSLEDSAHNQATMVDGMIRESLVEQKTGRPVGVWFENQECWMYRGTLPVILHFTKEHPSDIEPMHLSRCPPCEKRQLLEKHYVGRNVRRWMIVPA